MAGNALLAVMLLSLTLLGCASNAPEIAATLNQGAALTGELPANPLQWRVITSIASAADSTMSTLYGNDLAVQYARSNPQHNYPNGSGLSLVTWTQQEDSRWYGAKIPAAVKSVEFVFVTAAAGGQPSYSYQKFAGTPLIKTASHESQVPDDRTVYLISQRAAVMP